MKSKICSLFFLFSTLMSQAQTADELTSQGFVYYNQGLYGKAEPLFMEAKKIWKKDPGKESAAYATACNNLASLYNIQGLYTKAEPLFIEAKTIREKTVGKESADYAMSCNN